MAAAAAPIAQQGAAPASTKTIRRMQSCNVPVCCMYARLPKQSCGPWIVAAYCALGADNSICGSHILGHTRWTQPLSLQREDHLLHNQHSVTSTLLALRSAPSMLSSLLRHPPFFYSIRACDLHVSWHGTAWVHAVLRPKHMRGNLFEKKAVHSGLWPRL